jgi:hypothetical protein
MMGEYFSDAETPDASKRAFAESSTSRGEKNMETALRNWNYVLGKAQEHQSRGGAEGGVRGLIRIQEGEDVGDWRDSINGLGGGKYPGSVNVDLVANSLRSIDTMIRTGIFKLDELKAMAKKKRLAVLRSFLDSYSPSLKSRKMEGAIRSWESAKNHFKVRLSTNQVRERLSRYLLEHPLDENERKLIQSTEIEKGCTVEDFLTDRKNPDVLSDGIEFYALSLDESGKPVPVLSSDACFRLLTGKPDPKEIRKILKLITLPYPLGLYSDVGIFAANPMYSEDERLRGILDRNGYHGTVVWGMQNAMMQKGLMRQIRRFTSPEHENDPKARQLAEEMRQALRSIHRTEEKVGDMVNFELWTYGIEDGKMKPLPYGQNASDETESNAIQLWSTVGISVAEEYDDLIRHPIARLAGFN